MRIKLTFLNVERHIRMREVRQEEFDAHARAGDLMEWLTGQFADSPPCAEDTIETDSYDLESWSVTGEST